MGDKRQLTFLQESPTRLFFSTMSVLIPSAPSQAASILCKDREDDQQQFRKMKTNSNFDREQEGGT